MKKQFQKILALVFQVHKQITDGEVHLLAKSLSYSTVLSLIPFFAVSLSVFHAFGGLDKLYKELEPIVLENLASAAGKAALGGIQNLVIKINPRALGMLGFLGLLFTSTGLLIDMEAAIQKVWGVSEQRSLTMRIFFSWIIIFLGPLTLASFLSELYADKIGFFYLHRAYFNGFTLWLIVFSIYQFVPSSRVRFKWSFFSSILTTFSLGIGQKIFSMLAKSIFTYNKVYGSLAAIPIFFIWISILWWIFLIGVALCAALNREASLQNDFSNDH